MMKFWNSLFVLSLCAFLLANPTKANDWDAIYKIYKNAQSNGIYVEPGLSEFKKAETLFSLLFKGVEISSLQPILHDLHLKLIKMTVNQKDFQILFEAESYKRGRGFYIFSQKKHAKNALQMPHSKKDLYTGVIGLSMFIEGNFVAAAWNSVPRYYSYGNKTVLADLADFSKSYFIAFSNAFARSHNEEFIIQLHGFSTKKRKTQIGEKSSFIISSGTMNQNHRLSQLDRCLEKRFSVISSIYPFEINELGGTKNEIGIALRKMGHAGFLHIEISKTMRNNLRLQKSMRKMLLTCIEDMNL